MPITNFRSPFIIFTANLIRNCDGSVGSYSKNWQSNGGGSKARSASLYHPTLGARNQKRIATAWILDRTSRAINQTACAAPPPPSKLPSLVCRNRRRSEPTQLSDQSRESACIQDFRPVYFAKYIPGIAQLALLSFLGIQHFANFACKRVRREGLLQKHSVRRQKAVIRNGVVGVTGNKENLDVRPYRAQLVGQFRAVHGGHDHVGNQQVDSFRIILGTTSVPRGRLSP